MRARCGRGTRIVLGWEWESWLTHGAGVGVCGTDPFRDMGRFLKRVLEEGFAGVQNFPTVGLFDGVFRQNIEETGMMGLPIR